MTYTLRRYQSYQEYLDDEDLSSEGNYRLLSTPAQYRRGYRNVSRRRRKSLVSKCFAVERPIMGIC